MRKFSDEIMSLKLRKPGESDKGLQKDSSRTVLELMKDEGLNPQAHCQEGFCGFCRCKMKSGEVDHEGNDLAFKGDDEILPCVAKIKSKEIVIEPKL
tara:strand:+ start:224 stop:514 length:291 start_codon:yes stop_codon:yes gene_type:complete